MQVPTISWAAVVLLVTRKVLQDSFGGEPSAALTRTTPSSWPARQTMRERESRSNRGGEWPHRFPGEQPERARAQRRCRPQPAARYLPCQPRQNDKRSSEPVSGVSLLGDWEGLSTGPRFCKLRSSRGHCQYRNIHIQRQYNQPGRAVGAGEQNRAERTSSSCAMRSRDGSALCTALEQLWPPLASAGIDTSHESGAQQLVARRVTRQYG